jgi:hypothetical protein
MREARLFSFNEEAAMATSVKFTPDHFDFGAVIPGSTGPDISVDPSFGPPQVSFAGAVQIKVVPVDANVTAAVAEGTAFFKVRDIIALEWVWEEVDPGELGPGHHGPPPKVKVLEVAAQSDGVTPLAVKQGQYLLVRVEYLAPNDGGVYAGKLVVLGDAWDPIQVPLSFYLSYVSTTVLHTPIELAQGTPTDVTVEFKVAAGPDSNVRYEISQTQLHSGVSIVGQNEFIATSVAQQKTLQLRTAIDAPVGDNNLAIDQFFLNRRSGLFVPVTIRPFATIQAIHGLTIVPEPSALTLRFTTQKLSRPTVTIWRRTSLGDPVKEMVPRNKVAFVDKGPPPATSHSIRVGGLPNATTLWFRIDADVEVSGIPPGAFANYDGPTATLQRVCVVHVWSIEVLSAGGDDSGSEDGNEIDFGMVVFDQATGQALINPTYAKLDSVNSGDVLTNLFGANDGFVQVHVPTDTIVPYIMGVNQDTDLDNVVYWGMPATLPGSPNSGTTAAGSWADAYGPFRLPATVGQVTSNTMVLSTGLTLLSYLARLTFETTVTDPLGALNFIYTG